MRLSGSDQWFRVTTTSDSVHGVSLNEEMSEVTFTTYPAEIEVDYKAFIEWNENWGISGEIVF